MSVSILKLKHQINSVRDNSHFSGEKANSTCQVGIQSIMIYRNITYVDGDTGGQSTW